MTGPIRGPGGYPDPRIVQPVTPAEGVHNKKKGPQEQPSKDEQDTPEARALREQKRKDLLNILNKKGKADVMDDGNESGQHFDGQA